MQGLPDQQLVERVVANVGNDRHQVHQQGADIAKLRARLDELRQPHLRPLGGVPGHEQGAERAPQHDGNGRPDEVRTHANANDPDGKCR
ncbi:hypothetical protein D3C76_1512430 [compost metagenome]